MTEALHKAAQAVLDRWDSPQWEWRQHGPTADLMAALRAALAQPPAPTAQPAADDRLRMSLRAALATESLAVDDLLRAMGEDPETYRTEGGAINSPRLLAWLKDRDAQPVQQPGDNLNSKSVQNRLAVQQPGAEPVLWADLVKRCISDPAVAERILSITDNMTEEEVDAILSAPCEPALAAPAQRRPLSGAALETLCEQFSLDVYQVRAIEAAHGITAAPAAQKGEKL